MIKSILFIFLCAPIKMAAQVLKKQAGKGLVTTSAKTALSIRSAQDSFSYAIGLNLAINLKEKGINNLNNEAIAQAIRDVYSEATPAIDLQSANEIVQKIMNDIAAKKMNEEKLAGLNFLNEYKKRPGIKSTVSGLHYEILKQGTGLFPTDSSKVKIIFSGSLINGKPLTDSDAENNKPVEIKISSMIAGWAEALKLMAAGSKWKILVPFYLAYGDQPVPPQIPAGASLIFEIELLEIVK